MRSFCLLIAAAALGAAAAAGAAPADFVSHFKAANAAHAAKDYARMESELVEALKLRPAHPAATYNLAAALALRGKGDAAVEQLQALADMGLVFDAQSDPDLASLKGTKPFERVLKDFAGNREPAGRAEREFRLRSTTFIPEGLAYDEEDRHFYVGSVRERRIQRVRRGTDEEDFVRPGKDLWSVLGMSADARSRLLWVASSALPEMKDADAADLGRAALLAYDMDDGSLKHRAVLDGSEHVLGDVIAVRDAVYTTDSRGGLLYQLDPKTGKFEALTQPGELASPQGMAATRDRRGLYIADYTQGLFYFDLKKKKLQRLEVGKGICVYGIDGLYRHEDDLIAVQNGIQPHRIVQLKLERNGKRVRRLRVLAANLKEFEEPTLGAIAEHRFWFIANSQWNRFDANHQLPPADQLKAPQILSIELGAPEDEQDRSLMGPRQAAPVPGQGLPVPCVPPLC